MASTVTYYRPGGVPGVYAVQVTLDLQPSQWAKVEVGRYRDRGYQCGSCGHQHPINPLQTETHRVEQYAEFRDIWERDTVTIEIHERALGEEGPYQIVVYTASRAGIHAQSLPCTRHGRTWQQEELKFNKIDLIDADTSSFPSQQQERDVFCVRNGFVVRGLLALPIPRRDGQQQVLIPVLRREARDQVAHLN